MIAFNNKGHNLTYLLINTYYAAYWGKGNLYISFLYLRIACRDKGLSGMDPLDIEQIENAYQLSLIKYLITIDRGNYIHMKGNQM